MEIYKRKVGYEDFSRTQNLTVTATTLYFPFLLTQNFEDIGIYTDAENPTYEIVNLSGLWDLSNNATPKVCLVLNNCTVNFTSTPITYFNANNGTLTAVVSGCQFTPSPTSIKWTGPNGFSNSGNLTAGFNNLMAGTYTLKITDDNCDITYANYVLQQPQSLSFALNTQSSQTNPTSPGGCNGTASVLAQGGLPPYTYLWYSGNTSNVIAGPSTTITGLTNLCAGTYNVQITDSATPQTLVSGIFVITEPSPISGSVVTTTNINCFGDNDGSITVNAEGGIHPTGYTYVLSGPVSDTLISTGVATFNNLPVGTYTCTIYDSVGSLTTLTIILTSPTPVVTTVTSSNTLVTSIPTPVYAIGCYGSTSGDLSITPTGGVSPYNIFINGDSLITPGTSIYTNTSTGPITINNLGPATYTITNTDTNDCNAPIKTIVLKQRPKLNIVRTTPTTNFNGYNLPCFGSSTGITFQTSYFSDATTTTPTSDPIQYYLNGVPAGAPVTGLITTKTIAINAGTHTITAVNTITNCSASMTVTLTQPPLPLTFTYGVINAEDDTCGTVTAPMGGGSVICSPCGCGNCRQGIIDINGGVTPYTILWSDTSTLITSNSACAGTILTVTVTDANGCIVGPTSITLSP